MGIHRSCSEDERRADILLELHRLLVSLLPLPSGPCDAQCGIRSAMQAQEDCILLSWGWREPKGKMTSERMVINLSFGQTRERNIASMG